MPCLGTETNNAFNASIFLPVTTAAGVLPEGLESKEPDGAAEFLER